ncbi:hypothetical protein R8G61_12885 [Tenacibaculum maritimum]
MKPYKVTISHFLNTNLKPFVMKGDNYYPIYIKVTAKRTTTKTRSLVFKEHYTQTEFDEIISSEEIEDIEMIKNEVSAIERIARITINELKEFDTAFFYSFVDFSNTLSIWECDVELLQGYDYSSKLNTYKLFGIDLIYIYLKEKMELIREPTLFEFYGETGQGYVLECLEKQSLKYDLNTLLNNINKLHFYKSINYFKYYVEGNRKTKPLKKNTVYFLRITTRR